MCHLFNKLINWLIVQSGKKGGQYFFAKEVSRFSTKAATAT